MQLRSSSSNDKEEINRLKIALEASYARLIIEKRKSRSLVDFVRQSRSNLSVTRDDHFLSTNGAEVSEHSSLDRINLSDQFVSEGNSGINSSEPFGILGTGNLATEDIDPIPFRGHRENRSREEYDLCNIAALKGAQYTADLIAHEAKQPVAAATNFLNVLKIKLGKSSTDFAHDDLLDYIGSELQRTISVLDKSRKLWQSDENYEVVNMMALINDLRCVLDREVMMANGKLDIFCDASDGFVAADSTQLKHVIHNLIRNSIEAFNKDSNEILISISNNGHDVVLSIEDNGVGPEGDVEHLFQPFKTTKTRGNGLGLFLSRSIIQAHNGQIKLGQGEECGAVVTITLPCAKFENTDNGTHVSGVGSNSLN